MIGRPSTPSLRIRPLSLLANLALRRPRNIEASTLGRDAMAGAISAVVQIAYCISFAALIFTGDLAGGFSLGLAGLIMGTVVTCVVIAVTSTFSPVIGGPELAGRGGDERAGGLDRHRARRQGCEHVHDHRQCARRALGQHAAHRHPALRRRRAEDGAMAPLHTVPGDRRLPCRLGYLAHHRRCGGGDPDRSHALALELGTPLFDAVWTADPDRGAVRHRHPAAWSMDSGLSRIAGSVLRVPHHFGRKPVRGRRRRRRAQRLVPAEPRRAEFMVAGQFCVRRSGRLGRDCREQRRDRLVLRRDGHRPSARRVESGGGTPKNR